MIQKTTKKNFYRSKQTFSIRKYHLGAASVMLGACLILGQGSTVVADEVQALSSEQVYVGETVSADTVTASTEVGEQLLVDVGPSLGAAGELETSPDVHFSEETVVLPEFPVDYPPGRGSTTYTYLHNDHGVIFNDIGSYEKLPGQSIRYRLGKPLRQYADDPFFVVGVREVGSDQVLTPSEHVNHNYGPGNKTFSVVWAASTIRYSVEVVGENHPPVTVVLQYVKKNVPLDAADRVIEEEERLTILSGQSTQAFTKRWYLSYHSRYDQFDVAIEPIPGYEYTVERLSNPGMKLDYTNSSTLTESLKKVGGVGDKYLVPVEEVLYRVVVTKRAIVNPEPIQVANLTQLTPQEKDAVSQAILSANTAFTTDQIVVADNGQATVSFSDGSHHIFTPDQTVVGQPRPMAERYNLTPLLTGIKAGQQITPESLVANRDELPADTRFSWTNAAPQVEQAGTSQYVLVTATFSDGSTKNVRVRVSINQTDAQKYVPVGNAPRGLTAGSALEPEDLITNSNSLPQGTQFEWVTQPNLRTSGGKLGRVRVRYPDGTFDEVLIRFTVR